MRMTKLGHSCVRLERDGRQIVLDPGVWSGADPLAGAQAVLITHEHADHLDAGVVSAALGRDPALELWTNAAVAAQFDGFGDRVHAVRDGDAFTAAGFDVHVYGRDHAVIHPELPVVPNIGFAVDGTLFHPGDSFTVPGVVVYLLLLPMWVLWLLGFFLFD
jgi:L-ascorbate metabolism protein UlaG (beta-lactamase superfamily)